MVLSHRCAMVWGHGPQLSIHGRRWAQRCPRGAILLSVPHGAGGRQGCVPPAGFGSPHPNVGRGVLSTSYPLPIPNPKPSQNLLLFPFLGLPHAQGPTFPPCRGKISSVPRLQASFCPPPKAADHQGCALPLSPPLQNLLRTAAAASKLFPFERINKPQQTGLALLPHAAPGPHIAGLGTGGGAAELSPNLSPGSRANKLNPPCKTSRAFEMFSLSIPLFCLHRRGGCARAEAPGDVKPLCQGLAGFFGPAVAPFLMETSGDLAFVFPLPPRKLLGSVSLLEGVPQAPQPPAGCSATSSSSLPQGGQRWGLRRPAPHGAQLARPPHGAPEALVWLRGCSP